MVVANSVIQTSEPVVAAIAKLGAILSVSSPIKTLIVFGATIRSLVFVIVFTRDQEGVMGRLKKVKKLEVTEMIERIKRKMRTIIGIKRSVRWVLGLCILVVLAVACVLFVLSVTQEAVTQEAYVLLPPHQIAAKQNIYLLMYRYKETLSFFAAGGPDEDKIIEGWKKLHTVRQSLELELGPLEIREDETVDKATRFFVPVLSEKVKNLSTGKVHVLSDHELGDLLLEKQQTPEGQRWRIIDAVHPNYAEIESTWLKLPRKKVPGSPRIILKKAIVMQILSDGEIVSEKTILYDE